MASSDHRPARGPAWLPAAGAGLHLALAALLAGSALILLLEASRDDPGLVAGWSRALALMADALASERKRSYALALLGIAALGPILVGGWDGYRAMRGRGGPAVALAALLAAIAGVVLYVVLVGVIMRTRGVYVTIIARQQLGFSQILLGLYGLLYIPVAVAAGALLRRLVKGRPRGS